MTQNSSNSMALLAPVWTHMTTLQPVRGEGIYLYDDAGGRYTDFTSGIGVTSTGHCHPRVVEAIREQAGQLIFGQINIVVPPAALALAEKLKSVTPPREECRVSSRFGSGVQGQGQECRVSSRFVTFIAARFSFCAAVGGISNVQCYKARDPRAFRRKGR